MSAAPVSTVMRAVEVELEIDDRVRLAASSAPVSPSPLT